MKLLTYPKEVTPKLIVTKAQRLGIYSMPTRSLTILKTRAQGSSTVRLLTEGRDA